MHTFSKSFLIPHTCPLPALASLSASLHCATLMPLVGTWGTKGLVRTPLPQDVLRLGLCVRPRTGRGVLFRQVVQKYCWRSGNSLQGKWPEIESSPRRTSVVLRTLLPRIPEYVGELSSHITQHLSCLDMGFGSVWKWILGLGKKTMLILRFCCIFLPYFLFLFQTVPVQLLHHKSTVTSIKGDVFFSWALLSSHIPCACLRVIFLNFRPDGQLPA